MFRVVALQSLFAQDPDAGGAVGGLFTGMFGLLCVFWVLAAVATDGFRHMDKAGFFVNCWPR